MPPKRKAAPKKKQETPPTSESEPESEPEEYSSESEEEEEPESPKPKKTKAAPKPKGAAAAAAKAKVAPTPSPKKGKAAPPKKQPLKRGAVAEKPAPSPSPEKTASKQVVIEHCKQCQSFKRTATKLEQLLKKSIPDLEVTMNPEKPRKGIFEVRDGDGNVFISLAGLVRPFKKMKDLNLEETADEVVEKLT